VKVEHFLLDFAPARPVKLAAVDQLAARFSHELNIPWAPSGVAAASNQVLVDNMAATAVGHFKAS